MKRLLVYLREFIKDRFNLLTDKADETLVVENITRDASFKGTNLWTLIFAIFIASIGLNVNSTAVIIGAMLISPLMGPIIAIGLGIGINDFSLLKKGAKNLAIASVISIATSTFYFTLTPLHDAGSELLARTSPSLWDVFIAFFGGLAGIVAGTRKEKSNVIPGVAIATALMPPLCTAGFGIASGRWLYALGALYLFFINSLFICIATFLVVKRLHFKRVKFATEEMEKRVSRYIVLSVIITVLPSIYLAYRIVQRSIFEENAQTFVKSEFHFARTQVVTHNYVYDNGSKEIELLLVGQPLSDAFIDTIKKRMNNYKLDGTKLVVRQGLDAKQNIDLSAIKASVLEEVFAAEHVADTLQPQHIRPKDTLSYLRNELRVLYPDLISYSLSQAVYISADTIPNDTISLFAARFKSPLDKKEKVRLSAWLKQRLNLDTIKVITEP